MLKTFTFIGGLMALFISQSALAACGPTCPDVINKKLPNATLVKKIDLDNGIKAWALKNSTRKRRNNKIIVYTTPTGELLVGTVFSKNGANLTKKYMADVFPPLNPADYKAEIKSLKGPKQGASDDKAKTHLYVMLEPNCPYCNRLWNTLQKVVKEKDGLQIHYSFASFLRPYSSNQVEAILSAKNPLEALEKHEDSFRKGGADRTKKVTSETKDALARTKKLMNTFEISGLPASIYEDEKGNMQIIRGAITKDKLMRILNGK